MKSGLKALYAEAGFYSLLILAVWHLLPLKDTAIAYIEELGITFKKPREEDTARMVEILCRLGVLLTIFIQSNCKAETPKDRAFVKKYRLPMTLAFLPMGASHVHFLVNGLLTIYRNEGSYFMTIDFLWIPILAILYFVHKYLERAYEDFRLDED